MRFDSDMNGTQITVNEYNNYEYETKSNLFHYKLSCYTQVSYTLFCWFFFAGFVVNAVFLLNHFYWNIM